MIPLIYFIPMIFLVVLSILDIKTFDLEEGAFPSALTSGIVLICFILNPNPSIFILAVIIAIILLDMELYSGMADLKLFIASSLVMPSIYFVFLFACSMSVLAVPYKYIIKRYTNLDELPFIPIIAIGYMVTLVLIFL